MNQLNAHGPLADRGRDALGAATAHVTDGEYTGDRGFEVKGWTRQRPAVGIAMQIGAGPYEPLVIERHTSLQPLRVGNGPRHEKHVPDIMCLGFAAGPSPAHSLQAPFAFDAGDFSLDVQGNVGCFFDTPDQIAGHRRSQPVGADNEMHPATVA